MLKRALQCGIVALALCAAGSLARPDMAQAGGYGGHRHHHHGGGYGYGHGGYGHHHHHHHHPHYYGGYQAYSYYPAPRAYYAPPAYYRPGYSINLGFGSYPSQFSFGYRGW